MTSPSACPYARAFAVLEQARAEKARITWAPDVQSVRVEGASPGLLGAVRELSGLRVLEGASEAEAVALEQLAATTHMVRVTRAGSTLRVVNLHDPRRVALERMVRAPDRVAREVLTLTPSILRELPLPWSLHLERRAPGEVEAKRWGAKQAPWLVTTSRGTYQAAQKAGVAAFVARELEAAALAVQVNRAFPRDLDGWLAAKRRGDWRLTAGIAGALDVTGVTEDMRSTLALGSVLDALDTDLVRAELHETKGG